MSSKNIPFNSTTIANYGDDTYRRECEHLWELGGMFPGEGYESIKYVCRYCGEVKWDIQEYGGITGEGRRAN